MKYSYSVRYCHLRWGCSGKKGNLKHYVDIRKPRPAATSRTPSLQVWVTDGIHSLLLSQALYCSFEERVDAALLILHSVLNHRSCHFEVHKLTCKYSSIFFFWGVLPPRLPISAAYDYPLEFRFCLRGIWEVAWLQSLSMCVVHYLFVLPLQH